MKLLSTEILENGIELVYADSADADAASSLVVVRLPREIDHAKSLAWNRFWALSDLRDFINEQIDLERATSEGRR